MEQTPQRIRWVVLAILIGSAIVLTILDSTGLLDTVVGIVRDPLSAASAITAARTDTTLDLLSGPRDLETANAEIARLQTENETLARENEELTEIQRKYQNLQELFNRASETPAYRRITADVIAYDTNPAVRSLMIDKGRDDGVRVGQPVEGPRGLVGQIYRVSNDAAQVALITETASAIPVRLGDSRATGVLRGGGRGNPPTIDWIDLTTPVEVGELVYTSGLGGKFPPDLVIGRVIDVERNEAELFQSAIVQPATDFNSLETLFVITDFQQVDTSIFEEAP
ncbi:MAG: rod shape-determining protein MreC [Chloroflexota bacterium]